MSAEETIVKLQQQVEALTEQMKGTLPFNRAKSPLELMMASRPETFSGDVSRLTDVLYSHELLFEMFRPSDAEKVLLTEWCLKGDALTWLRTNRTMYIQAHGQNAWPPAYSVFTSSLKHHFCDPMQERRAAEQIARLKQTGSVTQYTAAFTKLALQIPDMAPGEMFRRYHTGLKPELQLEVDKAGVGTFAAARDIAHATDPRHHHLRMQQQQPRAGHGNNFGHGGGPQPMQLGGMPMESAPRHNPHAHYKCYKCGTLGHIAKDCKNPKNQKKNF